MSAPVETFQAEWELDQLLRLVVELRPSRILEVGSMHGGTLWHWLQACPMVVAVDDEMRAADVWAGWAADSDVELRLFRGRSQDPDVVEQVAELGPFDFAFVDGDHAYESVLADWVNYGPHAKVVAFHDILPRPGYGVSRLWGQLKAVEGAKYVEICQNETLPGNEGRCGIGVLWT